MDTFSMLCPPFGSNPLVHVPPLTTYLPLPIISVWPRPVNLYQWPTSSWEVDLWSAVHFHSLMDARRIAHKILRQAVRRDDFLRDGRFIVTLKGRYVPEANRYLGRGAWVCPSEGVYGENVVELYAYLQLRTYSDAINVLAREGDLLGSAGDIRQQNKTRIWVQERFPLHPDVEATGQQPFYPWNSDVQRYENMPGHSFLRAIRWQRADGQFMRVYESLWRHRSSPVSQWAQVHPQPPFHIFNVNELTSRPNDLVVLVCDEFEAAKLHWTYRDCIFITISGGLKNLSKTKLELLRDRRVKVVMSQSDLEEGHRIHHALRTAGAVDLWFSLDSKIAWKPFRALEDAAAQLGVSLLPPPPEGILTLQSGVVISPGEKIPRGDMVRGTLYDPGIQEGDLVLLYGDSKTFKTRLALAMAYAAAKGNRKVGPWHTREPVGVLYVDGEMQPDALQKAISMVMAGAGDPSETAPFSIICAKSLLGVVVDIATKKWQETIEEKLHGMKGMKLLFLDNLQCLTDNIPGNFNGLRPWLQKLLWEGIAVIVVDHTNAEGEIQGSKVKPRIADLLIALSYPDELAKKEGRIRVEYPKARLLHGAAAEPFQLQTFFTERTFRLELVQHDTDEHIDVRPQVKRMALVVYAKDDEGLSYPEIHKKYDIPQSTAHGYYQKASKLIGDAKAALDQELQRLIAEGGQSTLK